MPAPAIGRRQRWLTPTATLDRSHPLAAGLRFCLNGATFVDLVTGRSASSLGQGRAVGSFGPMRNFTGTAGASIPADIAGAADLTVGVVVTWPSFANDDDLLMEYSVNSNSNDGFFIDPNSSSGGNQVEVKWRLGGQQRDYGFTRPTASADAQVWVFRFPFNDVATAYFNGGLEQTGAPNGAQGTQSGTYPVQTLYLASRNVSSLLAVCSISFVCIWGRLLTAAGAQAFYADPFQMLRW